MGQVPYLFTVLLSIIAWTTNQLSSEISKSPIIEITEYSYDEKTGNLEYLLTNISNQTQYKDLVFNFRILEELCISEPEVKWLPPNKKHKDTQAPECENNKSALLFVKQFQPSSQIKLQLKTGKPIESNLLLQSDMAVRLVDSSIETYIAKNKIHLLMSLFMLWILLLFVYIFGMKKKWFEVTS